MTEHNCEIPGWRCYGNGPIVLESRIDFSSAVLKGTFEDSAIYISSAIEVNYCPFCGMSDTLAYLARNKDG